MNPLPPTAKPSPQPRKKATPAQQGRKDRLASALRQNLLRRKAAASKHEG